jgi:hypothetical protein
LGGLREFTFCTVSKKRPRKLVSRIWMRERDEHGSRHVTPAGRSVFYDLFPKAEADELVMRSTLLRGRSLTDVPLKSPTLRVASM